MKINWYTIALKLLQGVVYIKRLLFWVLGFVWTIILSINRLYLKTVGFYIYRVFDRLKKRFQKFSFTRQQGVLGIFGRRGVLQFMLFVVALFIMFPHSKLYTRGYGEIAGRNTLLYALVGPGDQAYDQNNEIIAAPDMALITNSESWKQVAVNSGDFLGRSARAPIEFTGVVVGGGALNKPIIMPGTDIGLIDPDQPHVTSGSRGIIITYEVESGDVIGSIADKFGLKPETILSANNLTARSYIRPGQKLVILPVDGVVYTVAKGDTLSKIARTFDAKTDAIVDFNGIGATLKVGDELIIPGGVRPQAQVVPSSLGSAKGAIKNTAGFLPVILGDSNAIDKTIAPPPSTDAPAGVGYIWPTAAKIITQYFGLRHTGLDIAGPVGTPIYAIKAGTVIVSQCGWNGGYGCYIKVDHGGGIVSWYAHASKMFVEVGDTVTQGQTIALIGITGHTTGPHVHFEVRVNNKYQNPLSYVRK